jgi:TonB family protein
MRKIIFLLALSFLFVQSAYSQNIPKRATGGVCNSKATDLPLPSFAKKTERNSLKGSINVQIKIDKEGNVKSATSISGSPLLRKEAEESILKAKFPVTRLSGEPVEVGCTIVYNVYLDETFDPKVVNGGIINGMALNLVKPKYPAVCRAARCAGIIFVQVVFDTITNKIESAVAISGHPLLRNVSVEAVRESEFKVHDHFRSENLKQLGFVVYRFGDGKMKGEDLFSPEARKLFEAYKKMDSKIFPLSAYSLDSELWTDLENSPLVNYGNVDIEIEYEKTLKITDLKEVGLLNIKQTDNRIFGKIDVRKLVDLASLKEVTKINQLKILTIDHFPIGTKPIFMPKPEYPASAKAANIKGKVVVEILVDENGNVEEASIVSGHELFWKASLEAVKQAKFKPYKLSGKPVKVRANIVYNFN